MMMASGARVSQHVRLVRPLGSGAMGTVWLAHHERLDAEVAVKLIDRVLDERDPRARERFRREASLGAQLHSPHVVRIFDHGELEDGQPYLVMERLVGETLGSYLARVETLAPPLVVALATQLAAALDEAHSLGVVHRDVKPENLFLVDAGGEPFVKLLDFGVAKRATVDARDPATLTGAIAGTPEYMSPEQLLARDAGTPDADRWALAVVLYRCLTGRAPFTGETLPALTLAICQGDHEPPSALVALPPTADAWFSRAFSPERAARFASAAEMVEELARALCLDGPTTAPRLTPRPRDDVSNATMSTISGAAIEVTGRARSDASRALAIGVASLALSVVGAYVAADPWQASLPTSALTPPPEARDRATDEPSSDGGARDETLPTASGVRQSDAVSDRGGGAAPATSATAVEAARRAAPTARRHGQSPHARSPEPPSTGAKSGCENPFELDAEGDLVPRPGCM
jgi:serine/threonine-protein kinase